MCDKGNIREKFGRETKRVNDNRKTEITKKKGQNLYKEIKINAG